MLWKFKVSLAWPTCDSTATCRADRRGAGVWWGSTAVDDVGFGIGLYTLGDPTLGLYVELGAIVSVEQTKL